MDEKETCSIWDEYEKGRSYHTQIDLKERILKNIDFYEGKQWEKCDGDSHIPKIVQNITENIVNNKVSNILSGEPVLNFVSYSRAEEAQRFSDFNNYIEKEAKIPELRADIVLSGGIEGASFIHYYWDADAKGLELKYEGAMKAEEISSLNIVVADPREEAIQEQKWIIIVSRHDVEAVKKYADSKDKADMVVSDEEIDDYETEEQDGSNLCTMLTKYFKKDGVVYIQRAAKGVVLHEPIEFGAAEPDGTKSEDIDAENAESTDKTIKAVKEPYRAHLYPVEVYIYKRKKNCIYGRSEVEGTITVQKAINIAFSMFTNNVQLHSNGKVIAKEGALQGQEISNEPGEIITDHWQGNGDGVKYMQPSNSLNNLPLNLIDSLSSMIRTITGSSEVMNGEMNSSNQSGIAIAQLQQQALKPIEVLRKNFYNFCQRCGLIQKMFYHLYYDTYNTREYVAIKTEGDQKKDSKEVFNADDYSDIIFDCVVEAGAGTQYSEALQIAMNDNLLEKGFIDEVTYLESLPANVYGKKNDLIEKMKEGRANQVAQLSQMVEQQAQEIESMKKTIGDAHAVLSSLERMREEMVRNEGEAINRVTEANAIALSLAKMAQEVGMDATLFAQELQKHLGKTNPQQKALGGNA